MIQYLSLLIYLISPHLIQDGWQLEIEEDGIQVYTKDIPRQSIKAFRAVDTLPCAINKVHEVLRDEERKILWMPDCVSTQIISTDGDTVFARMVIQLPWPFENRDIIYCAWPEIAADTTMIYFEALPNKYERSGIPRIRYSVGHYKLIKLSSTETYLEYEALTNPGLNLPSWLINARIAVNPFETLKALRRYLSNYPPKVYTD